MSKDFLLSEKKIYDSLHGFIELDEFEKEVVNSLPFQRLHYIHQLGIAFLVYPGATHSRFEHSLGVMHIASKIFKRLCKTIRPDVFHLIPRKGSTEYIYWMRVLRMAALCHDMGHLPFSHTAEQDLLEKDISHEWWSSKIIQSDHLLPIWEKIKKRSMYTIPGRDFVEDIIKVSLGEKKYKEFFKTSLTSWERVISEIVTGDFFGADRIDYLLRDAKSTGVTYGLFDYHQLIEMLRILPLISSKGDSLSLGIDENGIESCEALLLARHFMHKRVYQYSSVQAYNFHLRRFMKETISKDLFNSVEDFLDLTDLDILIEIKKASKNSSHISHEDARSLFYRKGRFKAFLISDKMEEKELKDMKKKLQIPDSKIGWEFISYTSPQNFLSFSVAKKYLTLEKASECSQLLSSIPSNQNTWIYVAPEYEIKAMNFLNSTNLSE